jgi:hypothetical protein
MDGAMYKKGIREETWCNNLFLNSSIVHVTTCTFHVGTGDNFVRHTSNVYISLHLLFQNLVVGGYSVTRHKLISLSIGNFRM